MNRLLFVTSFFPYSNREAWVEDELTSINSDVVEVWVAPRSFGNEVLSQRKFNLINSPLFSFKILLCIARNFSFRKYFQILILAISQSCNMLDSMKRVAVLPKAIYIAWALKDKDIKHVHVYTTTSAATMGSAIAFLLGVDWSFTVHTSAQLTASHRRTYTSLYKKAKFVRCISFKTMGDLNNFLQVEGAKSIVSQLGVVVTGRNNMPRVVNRRIIFIIAALEKYKGVQYAIHAIHQLHNMGIFVTCYVIGEGSQKKILQKICKDLCIDGSIIFMGQLPHANLIELLKENSGSALLLTSDDGFGQEEGIPVVVMEAMNCGLFVIATRNGAICEIIDHNFNGYLVAQRNVSEISAACARYIAMDEDLLNNYIDNARETIFSNFNILKNKNRLMSRIL